MELNSITSAVIDSALLVHAELGPGLLESAYEACLAHELHLRSLGVQRQVPVAFRYRGVQMDVGYRIDLLVEQQVIVEIKSVDRLAPIHMAQMLSYLKIAGRNVGLLLNFNTLHLRNGIKRVVRGLPE